ncbi:MAG: group II intron maturase-specific domain-containing protein [Actinomycetota bacterium]|nr:group II intron maturase-specific domain-containing protein [Actinomycetota bacterium]
MPGEHPDPWEIVVVRLNRKLRSWANYFSYGGLTKVRRGVDLYVEGRVSHFMRRRTKIAGRGTKAFPADRVFGELDVLSVLQFPRKRYENALG